MSSVVIFPFTMLEFRFADQQFFALPSGGLWLPESKTLVVADLHLGKGQSFARQGNLLPPYDDRATLLQLTSDIGQYQPERVWLLGDSFHRSDSPETVEEDVWEQIQQLASGREWVWLTGNHDAKSFEASSKSFPGKVRPELEESRIRYTHEPLPHESPNVFGHYHPKVRVQLRGRRLSGKCFLLSAQRLLCPAYGAYAGGLWWPEEPLNDYFEMPRFFLCHKHQVTEIREQSVIRA
ncbi:MAG: ligase-associated DNA damage response endonuclease PdeM [Verrucomicrobiota bacterium]